MHRFRKNFGIKILSGYGTNGETLLVAGYYGTPCEI